MSSLFAQTKLPQLGKDDISKVIFALSPQQNVHLVTGTGYFFWKNPSTGENTVSGPNVPGEAGVHCLVNTK